MTCLVLRALMGAFKRPRATRSRCQRRQVGPLFQVHVAGRSIIALVHNPGVLFANCARCRLFEFPAGIARALERARRPVQRSRMHLGCPPLR